MTSFSENRKENLRGSEKSFGSLSIKNDVDKKSLSRKIWYYQIAEKYLFLAFSTIVLALFLVQAIRCLIKFYEEPTYFSTHIVRQKFAEFPALSICPDNNQGYKEDTLRVI